MPANLSDKVRTCEAILMGRRLHRKKWAKSGGFYFSVFVVSGLEPGKKLFFTLIYLDLV
jgi:hypothetical protein